MMNERGEEAHLEEGILKEFWDLRGRINKCFCCYTTIKLLFYLNNGKNKSPLLWRDEMGWRGCGSSSREQKATRDSNNGKVFKTTSGRKKRSLSSGHEEFLRILRRRRRSPGQRFSPPSPLLAAASAYHSANFTHDTDLARTDGFSSLIRGSIATSFLTVQLDYSTRSSPFFFSIIFRSLRLSWLNFIFSSPPTVGREIRALVDFLFSAACQRLPTQQEKNREKNNKTKAARISRPLQYYCAALCVSGYGKRFYFAGFVMLCSGDAAAHAGVSGLFAFLQLIVALSSRSLAAHRLAVRVCAVLLLARHMLSIIFSFGLPFCDSFPILLHIIHVCKGGKNSSSSSQHINIYLSLCDVSFLRKSGFFLPFFFREERHTRQQPSTGAVTNFPLRQGERERPHVATIHNTRAGIQMRKRFRLEIFSFRGRIELPSGRLPFRLSSVRSTDWTACQISPATVAR